MHICINVIPAYVRCMCVKDSWLRILSRLTTSLVRSLLRHNNCDSPICMVRFWLSFNSELGVRPDMSRILLPADVLSAYMYCVHV